MAIAHKKLQAAMLLLVAIGIIDSAYLAYSHYNGTPVACPESGIIDCGKVLGSAYSTILGMPLGLLGLIFFVIELFALGRTSYENLVLLNVIGIAFVFYLLYAEYALGAICIYCTLVHVVVALLLAFSVYGYLNEKKRSR